MKGRYLKDAVNIAYHNKFASFAVLNGYIVWQKNREEFVELNNNFSFVNNTGGFITIYGKSNSNILTYSIDESSQITINLPEQYKVNNNDVNNGAEIGNEDVTYAFSINVEIPPAESYGNKNIVIKIQTQSGVYELYTIELEGLYNYIWLDEEDIDTKELIFYPTTSELSINVLSNTEWTINNPDNIKLEYEGTSGNQTIKVFVDPYYGNVPYKRTIELVNEGSKTATIIINQSPLGLGLMEIQKTFVVYSNKK